MPPLVVFALGVMGAAMLARWCVKEVHRVNAELDEMRAKASVEPLDRNSLPKLKARSKDRRISAGLIIVPSAGVQWRRRAEIGSIAFP